MRKPPRAGGEMCVCWWINTVVMDLVERSEVKGQCRLRYMIAARLPHE